MEKKKITIENLRPWVIFILILCVFLLYLSPWVFLSVLTSFFIGYMLARFIEIDIKQKPKEGGNPLIPPALPPSQTVRQSGIEELMGIKPKDKSKGPSGPVVQQIKVSDLGKME